MVNTLIDTGFVRTSRQPRLSALLRLALGSALFVSSARAEPDSPLSLNWVRGDGAESCVSARELDTRLREALAADNVAPAALSIEGWVQRDPQRGQWRARLRVLDAEEHTIGMRELVSSEASCEALTPSVVLVLAILVELGSGQRVQDDTPATAQSACPAPAPAVPTPQPAPTPKPTPAGWQVEPLAALTIALGLLPSAALGPQLGLRVSSPWPLALLMHGGYWPGGRESIAGAVARAAVDFRAYHGDLSLCLSLPRTGAFLLAGCWGAVLGARRAHVTGLLDARDTTRLYAAASASAHFGYAVTSRLSLGLETSFLGFAREDRYSFDDPSGARRVAFRSGRFTGLFALGLGVRL